MYNKLAISLAVASSIALTGCLEDGSSTFNQNAQPEITSNKFTGKTWPVFNPVTGELPLPNDLIFDSEAGDGSFSVTDTTPPVTTALNGLSGASTVAPIDLAISGAIDASSVDGTPFLIDETGALVLDPETGAPIPNPNQNVFLIELDYATDDPVQGLSVQEPPTIPTALPFAQLQALQAQLADDDPSNDAAAQAALPATLAAANQAARDAVDRYKVSVVEQSGKTFIRINLLKPLDPLKRYVAVVTDGVTDASGEPLIASPSYDNITDAAAPLGSDNLAPVRALMNGLWENIAANYFDLTNSTRVAQGMDPLVVDGPDQPESNIVLSYSFTTSDDEMVLEYMADPARWFSDRIENFLKVSTARQVVGAAQLVEAAANGTTEETLAQLAASDANDLNGDGGVTSADFDFNADGELTTADFDLSGGAGTPDGSFDFFDVEAAAKLAVDNFPSPALQQALSPTFDAAPPNGCMGLTGETAIGCTGTALESNFESALQVPGDNSDTVTLDLANATPAALVSAAVASLPGSSTAIVAQGSIEVPYYLGVPTETNGSAINDVSWTADNTLASTLNVAFSSIGLQLPQGVTSETTPGEFKSDVVNYIYPFPEKKEDLQVPMLVMFPQPGVTTDSGFTWNGTDQLPVVVFQHGITTDRSAALSVGSILTDQGFGVVAIDMPVHGVDAQDQSGDTQGVTEEKQALAGTLLAGFDANDADNGDTLPEQNTADNVAALIDGSYVDQVVTFLVNNFGCDASATALQIAGGGCGTGDPTVDGGAAQFAGFAIGAQNAVANHTSVIPGLARTDFERHFNFTADAQSQPVPMDFDAGVGSSGSLFINLNGFLNSRDKNRQGASDLVTLIKSIGGIDINGVAGGDFDTDKIYFAGHSLGTVAGSGAVAAVNNATSGNRVQATALFTPAAGIVRMLENSPSFAPQILGGLQAAGLEQNSENFELFMRVVQHAIDSADPVNLADNMAQTGEGVITFNIVGTEDENGNTLFPSDQTNIIEAGQVQLGSAFPDYLAGALPLSSALGATNVTAATAADGTADILATNLAYGAHGMFVLPNSSDPAELQRQSDAFSESMMQTAEFFLADGELLGPVSAENGRLGSPTTTPILDDRPIPTAQDFQDADNSDEPKQLNPVN